MLKIFTKNIRKSIKSLRDTCCTRTVTYATIFSYYLLLTYNVHTVYDRPYTIVCKRTRIPNKYSHAHTHTCSPCHLSICHSVYVFICSLSVSPSVSTLFATFCNCKSFYLTENAMVSRLFRTQTRLHRNVTINYYQKVLINVFLFYVIRFI